MMPEAPVAFEADVQISHTGSAGSDCGTIQRNCNFGLAGSKRRINFLTPPGKPFLLDPVMIGMGGDIMEEKRWLSDKGTRRCDVDNDTGILVCGKDWVVSLSLSRYDLKLQNVINNNTFISVSLPYLNTPKFLSIHRHLSVFDDPDYYVDSSDSEYDSSDDEGRCYRPFSRSFNKKFLLAGDPTTGDYSLVVIFEKGTTRGFVSVAYFTSYKPYTWIPLVSTCNVSHDAMFVEDDTKLLVLGEPYFIDVYNLPKKGDDLFVSMLHHCHMGRLVSAYGLTHDALFLVQHYDDVLVVLRSVYGLKIDGSGRCLSPGFFKLFKISIRDIMNHSHCGPMEEVVQLAPNTAIFLGLNASFSAQVDPDLFRPNHIYFSDTYLLHVLGGVGVADLASYELSSGTVEVLRRPPKHDVSRETKYSSLSMYRQWVFATRPQWLCATCP